MYDFARIRVLAGTASLLAFAWSGTTLAQAAQPTPDQPAPAPVSPADTTANTAPARDTGAGNELGEIVVTAQFRQQNLQDTPIAITAIGGADLQTRSITNLSQMSSIAPNVQLRPAGAEAGPATQALIRGVGQTDTSFAFEPAVGIYVDDVYYATLFGSQLDLLDLDRVEILRGPQGTLFGKNSLGGAVRIISRKPRGDNSGYIEGTYGSFDRLAIRGAFDAPIIKDVLAVRLSGAAEKRDGYQKLYDFTCAQPALAGSIPSTLPGPGGTHHSCKIGTYGGTDTLTLRGQVRFTPTSDLEINLTGDYLKDDSEAPPVAVTTIQSAAALDAFNNNVNIPRYGVAIDQRFQTTDPFKTYATNSDPTLGLQQTRKAPIKTWGSTLNIDYTVAPDLSLKSITAYRHTNGEFSTDLDGSPLQIQNLVYLLNTHQFSQELRLTGKAIDNRLNYTFGGFYFNASQVQRGGVENTLYALNFEQNDRFKTKNYSAYLNADFAVTDALTVVGGVRYSNEKKSFAFDHQGFLTVAEPVVSKFDRIDYRVALNYKITPDITAYGSVSTGFRSGGFNPRPFNALQLTSFGPEKLTAYELGLKNEFFDRRVRVNLAAFYSDYKDRIISVRGFDATGTPFEEPQNIGSAKIKGFEGELQAAIVGGLRFNGSFGYAKFTSPELEGLKQVAVPDWTADAGAEYRFDVGEGSVVPRIDWVYQSAVNYQLDNNPLARTPKRGLYNGRVSWNISNDLSAALSVTNIFDRRYYVQKFTYLDIGYGIVDGQPGRPREWAVSLRHNF